MRFLLFVSTQDDDNDNDDDDFFSSLQIRIWMMIMLSVRKKTGSRVHHHFGGISSHLLRLVEPECKTTKMGPIHTNEICRGVKDERGD